jgi:cytochrome o ubiquinol oxidase subunit 1
LSTAKRFITVDARGHIRQRDALRDETGDPWDGRSLGWATASPPPALNFAVLPNVGGEEPYAVSC